MTWMLSFILTGRLTVDRTVQLHYCSLSYRPLPRGLIPYKEAVNVINLVLGAMSMYAVLLSLRFSLEVGIMFGIAVGIQLHVIINTINSCTV